MAQFIFAAFLLLIGFPLAKWPYKITRYGEQIDSIGSKRAWSDVEPTDWNVNLTKFFGYGLILFGMILIITGLF